MHAKYIYFYLCCINVLTASFPVHHSSVMMWWSIIMHINTVTHSTSILTSTLHYFLWHQPKHANLHLSRGQQVKERKKCSNCPGIVSTLPHRFHPPLPLTTCFNIYQSIICFSFPFFFKTDNGPYFSCHHWHHCKSKLWEDWEKLVSADLWNLPSYWYMRKIQCER